MSQFQANKFNVAWFKLAEFVGRKEKERALGVYRLLVHSLPEESLAAQLEGDLLLAFNDIKALECYVRAAGLYERDGKIIQAIAIREHCTLLDADAQEEHFAHLVKLYAQINDAVKMARSLNNLIKYLIGKDRFGRALEIINETTLSADQKCAAYEFFVCEFLRCRIFNKITLGEPLDFIINEFKSHKADARIMPFLGALSVLSADAHDYVFAALTSNN